MQDVMNETAENSNANAPFPPAGWVDQDGAAKRLGVNPRTLRQWIEAKTLTYAGTLARGNNGNQRRIFEIAALDAARQRMRDAVAARATLPEGFVDRYEAARMLGVVPDTLALWHTTGRLRCGKWVKNTEGKRCKIYP